MAEDTRPNPLLALDFQRLYALGEQETGTLLDLLGQAEHGDIERRPSLRVWSAEEWTRHLAWIENAVLQVECLGMEPADFPEGFAVLPGQVLETHFAPARTREAIDGLRAATHAALSEVEPGWLDETVEDSGGRRVADNLARYLNLTAQARASARMALRLARASREAAE